MMPIRGVHIVLVGILVLLTGIHRTGMKKSSRSLCPESLIQDSFGVFLNVIGAMYFN